MKRALLVLALVALSSTSCSGGSDDGDSAARPGSGSTGTVAEGETLRVATLNVLHGLFCPAETDSCRAPVRAEIVADALEAEGCPELVGFQEIGPRQGEVVPAAMAEVCGGRYRLAWQSAASPDRAMVFTTLPIVEEGYLDLAAFPWEAYWVRVESDLGPVDFLTTHLASSANNPSCDATNCPPVCAGGIDTNECNAREVLEHLSDRSGAVLQIASGDFNATPGSPTIETFTNAGYVDVWLAAGRPECDPATGRGCTGDRPRPENPLDGLDVSGGRYSERIDFVLAEPSPDCELSAEAEPLFAEPLEQPVDELYWPSDHAGVIADLTCG